jgi:hypothetical protein
MDDSKEIQPKTLLELSTSFEDIDFKSPWPSKATDPPLLVRGPAVISLIRVENNSPAFWMPKKIIDDHLPPRSTAFPLTLNRPSNSPIYQSIETGSSHHDYADSLSDVENDPSTQNVAQMTKKQKKRKKDAATRALSHDQRVQENEEKRENQRQTNKKMRAKKSSNLLG